MVYVCVCVNAKEEEKRSVRVARSSTTNSRASILIINFISRVVSIS